MFSRKKKSNCVVSGCQLCQNIAVFSQDFIKNVIPYLRKDDEISGVLKIKDKDSRSINYIEGEDVKDPNRCKNGQCNNIYLISSHFIYLIFGIIYLPCLLPPRLSTLLFCCSSCFLDLFPIVGTILFIVDSCILALL